MSDLGQAQTHLLLQAREHVQVLVVIAQLGKSATEKDGAPRLLLQLRSQSLRQAPRILLNEVVLLKIFQPPLLVLQLDET